MTCYLCGTRYYAHTRVGANLHRTLDGVAVRGGLGRGLIALCLAVWAGVFGIGYLCGRFL